MKRPRVRKRAVALALDQRGEMVRDSYGVPHSYPQTAHDRTSGQPLSPHRGEQTPLWLRGELHPMWFWRARITAPDILVLRPR